MPSRAEAPRNRLAEGRHADRARARLDAASTHGRSARTLPALREARARFRSTTGAPRAVESGNTASIHGRSLSGDTRAGRRRSRRATGCSCTPTHGTRCTYGPSSTRSSRVGSVDHGGARSCSSGALSPATHPPAEVAARRELALDARWPQTGPTSGSMQLRIHGTTCTDDSTSARRSVPLDRGGASSCASGSAAPIDRDDHRGDQRSRSTCAGRGTPQHQHAGHTAGRSWSRALAAERPQHQTTRGTRVAEGGRDAADRLHARSTPARARGVGSPWRCQAAHPRRAAHRGDSDQRRKCPRTAIESAASAAAMVPNPIFGFERLTRGCTSLTFAFRQERSSSPPGVRSGMICGVFTPGYPEIKPSNQRREPRREWGYGADAGSLDRPPRAPIGPLTQRRSAGRAGSAIMSRAPCGSAGGTRSRSVRRARRAR